RNQQNVCKRTDLPLRFRNERGGGTGTDEKVTIDNTIFDKGAVCPFFNILQYGNQGIPYNSNGTAYFIVCLCPEQLLLYLSQRHYFYCKQQPAYIIRRY